MITNQQHCLQFARAQLSALAQQAQISPDQIQPLLTRFEQNLTALHQYHPEVTQQLAENLPDNIPVFTSESGALNLIDQSQSTAVYGADPVAQCQQQVDHVLSRPQLSEVNFVHEPDEYSIHAKYLNRINSVYRQSVDSLTPITQLPGQLGSSYLFGLGLGYHLNLLFEQVQFNHLYICEPNQEWFFASLLCCNWADIFDTIAQRNGLIYLHIGEKTESFFHSTIKAVSGKGLFHLVNGLYFQHYPSEQISAAIEQFNRDFQQLNFAHGFFDDGITALAHDFANGQKQLPMLAKQKHLPDNMQDVPVFIVANGPSIDQTIETLKACQGKGLIFCCGTAIRPLLNHGIVPDFYIAIERVKLSFDQLKQFVEPQILSRLNFLTTTVMHPDCSALFNWTGMALKPGETATALVCLDPENDKQFTRVQDCNPMVANTALSFACHIGFRQIYLLGVDCGYKDPDYHHSKESLYYSVLKDKDKQTMDQQVRMGEIVTQANFGGTALSSALLFNSKQKLEQLLATFEQVNCINCSDGVKIDGAKANAVSQLLQLDPLVDKQALIETIKSECFVTRFFDQQQYKNTLAITRFDQLCDSLTELIQQPFSTRAEVAQALTAQIEQLYQLANTEHRHLFLLLEGTFSYVHSVLRMQLNSFADEQQTLIQMKKALTLFSQYLQAAKLKYRRVLDEIDQQSYDWATGLR